MSDRILVISPRYWPEKYKINDICEGFVKRGLKVDVITGQPNYPNGRFFKGYHSFGHRSERHRKVNIIRVPEFKKGSGVGIRIMLNYLCFSFFSRLRVGRIHRKKYKAVLIYQTSPVMACRGGINLAKRQNIPVITYAIDLWPYSMYKELDIQSGIIKSIYNRKSKRCYLDSDKIAVLTSKAGEYFTRDLEMHPSKVKCIKTGPDLSLQIGGDDSNIIERFAGSFNIVIRDENLDIQDLDTIINAGRLILNAGIRDLKFIIVAGVRPDPSILKKIYKMNLGDMIYIEKCNIQESLTTYYNIADAFLSCARPAAVEDYDYPGEVVNYISLGKPVLFAGDGEGKRIVRDSGCGLICDPEDEQSLFNIVIALYRTPAVKFKQMGKNAKEYQLKYYNNEACIDGLLEMMKERKPEGEDEFMISGSSNVVKTDDLFDDDGEEDVN